MRQPRDVLLALLYFAATFGPGDRLPSFGTQPATVTAATVHALFCLCWIALLMLAGGLPNQTRPRFKKDECIAAFVAEYNRRGRPIETHRLSPENIHTAVLNHFQNTNVGPLSVPIPMVAAATPPALASPTASSSIVPWVAPTPPAVVDEPDVPQHDEGVIPDLYDCVFTDGAWHLGLYCGVEVQTLPLPPVSADGCGYWQLVEFGGDMYVYQGEGTEMVNCAQSLCSTLML
jgi:hypothetical protein